MKTSATALAAAISAAFVRSAEIEAGNITVNAGADGAVVLEGVVYTAAERRRAVTAAWSAPGVTQVTNHLQIVV